MQVIEGQHAIEEHEHAIGNVKVVHRMLPDILETPHDVVCAVSDCARGKRWQAFHGGRVVLAEQLLDDLEDVSRAPLDFADAFDRDFRAARFQPQERPDAEKRVAADPLPALDRLQQKRVGLTGGDGEKGGDGGEQVGRDRLGHRNQGGRVCQAGELFEVGTDHLPARLSILSEATHPYRNPGRTVTLSLA